MQSRAIVLLGLLATGALAARTSQKAQTQALAWVQAHPNAEADDLEDVKEANPEAYAIVKALLTKRSLGLLDPKHPSASFTNAKPASADSEEAPVGAAAFAKFATADELKGKPDLPQKESSDDSDSSMASEPEPVHHAQHDWLNWKPQDSATADDAMVKNVLGAVAGLKGGGNLRASNVDSGSALSVDEDAFGVDEAPVTTTVAAPAVTTTAVTTTVAVAPVEAPPVASMNQENSYLRGLDLGAVAPKPRARPLEDNSYLKGLDLSGEAPHQAAVPKDIGLSSVGTQGGLAGFSWDDDKPAQTITHAPSAKKQRATKPDALAGWLGLAGKSTRVQPKAVSPVAPTAPAQEAPENPYTAALN